MNRRITATVAAAVLAATAVGLGASATAGAGGRSPAGALESRGPITIWLSNNAAELEWGTAMVEAWNAEHPDEEITAQEIPAGRTSEEVIGAAITAGNAPCLIFNTAPAAVPQFQRQGGLVSLDSFADGADYVAERSGDRAEQYRSSDGGLYQMPWKANPVMIIYNKAVFEEAGLDPDNPPLATYDEFLATAQTLVDEGGVQAAIWPSPAGEFFQPWFDFYPMYIAQSGLSLVEDGQATFASEDGFAVAEFWRSLYDSGLTPREAYPADAFADGQFVRAAGVVRLIDFAWLSAALSGLPAVLKKMSKLEMEALRNSDEGRRMSKSELQRRSQENQVAISRVEEMKADELGEVVTRLYGDVVRVKIRPSPDQPAAVLVGSAYARHFYDSPAALSQKYSIEIDAGWTVLGQLNVPNPSAQAMPIPTGNRMEDAFEQIALLMNNAFKLSSAPVFPAISFTPIAIYRASR